MKCNYNECENEGIFNFNEVYCCKKHYAKIVERELNTKHTYEDTNDVLCNVDKNELQSIYTILSLNGHKILYNSEPIDIAPFNVDIDDDTAIVIYGTYDNMLFNYEIIKDLDRCGIDSDIINPLDIVAHGFSKTETNKYTYIKFINSKMLMNLLKSSEYLNEISEKINTLLVKLLDEHFSEGCINIDTGKLTHDKNYFVEDSNVEIEREKSKQEEFKLKQKEIDLKQRDKDLEIEKEKSKQKALDLEILKMQIELAKHKH
jgi:hypothetical protein